ncbi:phage major capsid protein [Clostridium tertium]|uniref:Phage major capsid protein n=1 Tax=Clostridium tertium TaxID=1559 RepID=A0A9X4B1P0_9CLOT|nr:phage major capsid protein [Clostridium tertium]MDC4241955.1 phage major capsid protein [Clostridium tertium]
MNLEQLLQQAREKRAALYESIKTAATMEEVDKIELDIRKAEIDIKSLEEQITLRDAGAAGDPAARSLSNEPEQRNLNPLGTYGRGISNRAAEGVDEDIYGSLAYRTAFRNYVVNGTPIPEEYRNVEERADAITVVGDAAAVIPTTIMNKVIEDLTVEGKIINRITQTSFQGGVKIPISDINPTATWLASEAEVSDEQKAEMKASVSFSYHVLEAKVAIGLLTSTVTLGMFESTVIKQLKKAMIKAIETAVIAGTGSGQPKGLTKYTLPAEQIIEFTDKEIGTVKGWARAEAAIPEAYEDSEIYLMNKQTWEMHLNGMTDTNGQKIGLGKINEKGQKILNGREVLTTDKFPGFDNAEAGAIFGALVNLEDYILNSNLAMYYKKYFNEDKNKWIHKALMIADGQMAIGESDSKLVGAKGLIYLKKKATV